MVQKVTHVSYLVYKSKLTITLRLVCDFRLCAISCFSPFFCVLRVFLWYVPSSRQRNFPQQNRQFFSICERIQASNLHAHTKWKRMKMASSTKFMHIQWLNVQTLCCVCSLVSLCIESISIFYLDLFLAQKSATCITLCKRRIRSVLLLRIFSKQAAANVWYQPRIM